ncbi:MAG: galactonate dehydratase [Candidatus Limiplasma sp.]|nr:galactonate dehydratase [Candidatus Limiplasma sp.]
MKITDVKAYTMDAFRTNWTFIKVETDEGLYGWGEASLGTREKALEGCVEDLKRHVVGRNPIDIEKMLFEVYRDSYWKDGSVFLSALSGIEIAMWDIVGKHYHTPVCNLLGGRIRERVTMYANAWFTGARTPEDFARKAKETVALGIKALKWDPFGKAHMTMTLQEMDQAVACVGAVRDAVGPHVELLIECHGRFNPYTAIEISRQLAPFRPMLMEEPVQPDNLDSLARVHRRSLVPIAAGERIYSKYMFRDALSKNALDIAQPDIFHTGGILESKKIAAMCEADHIPVSFHNPSGPISNAAILQLAACVPNFLIHEIMLTDSSFRFGITDEEVVYENGEILIPSKPGLGIDVNVEEVLKSPYTPRNLRHYTGELTNIRPQDDTVYYFKGLK